MGEASLSLNVDANVNKKLQDEARLQKVSVDNIAERAIERYLEIQEYEREILRERFAEADKGIFITGEAMHRWTEDLFAGKRTTPPQPDVFLPPREHSGGREPK